MICIDDTIIKKIADGSCAAGSADARHIAEELIHQRARVQELFACQAALLNRARNAEALLRKPVHIKAKRLDDRPLPKHAKPGDAGLDLTADRDMTLPPGARAKFKAGFALEIPPNHAGFIVGRSGLSLEKGTAPFFGTIDAPYRGEVGMTMLNGSMDDVTIRSGQRIAQMVIVPVLDVVLEEVEELADTERGASGFGSTGT